MQISKRHQITKNTPYFSLPFYHKFEHGFQNEANPLCSRGNDIESNYLYIHAHYANEKATFLDKIRDIKKAK